MLFAAPPITPPEPQTTLTHVVSTPVSFHHERLTFDTPSVWTLKGNPKALLDEQSFRLPSRKP